MHIVWLRRLYIWYSSTWMNKCILLLTFSQYNDAFPVLRFFIKLLTRFFTNAARFIYNYKNTDRRGTITVRYICFYFNHWFIAFCMNMIVVDWLNNVLVISLCHTLRLDRCKNKFKVFQFAKFKHIHAKATLLCTYLFIIKIRW